MEVSTVAFGLWSILCIGVGYGLHEIDLSSFLPLVFAFGVLVYGIVLSLRHRFDD